MVEVEAQPGGGGVIVIVRAPRHPGAVRDRGRDLDRGDQAVRPCHAPARDVERRAVVGRGAHERQPQGDVHRPVEIQRLHRISAWSWYMHSATS